MSNDVDDRPLITAAVLLLRRISTDADIVQEYSIIFDACGAKKTFLGTDVDRTDLLHQQKGKKRRAWHQ